jgi:hypothetical protein
VAPCWAKKKLQELCWAENDKKTLVGFKFVRALLGSKRKKKLQDPY